MEKGVEIELDSYMRSLFNMKEVDISSYSPLTLAYIGDSIYDLIIKTLVTVSYTHLDVYKRQALQTYRCGH